MNGILTCASYIEVHEGGVHCISVCISIMFQFLVVDLLVFFMFSLIQLLLHDLDLFYLFAIYLSLPVFQLLPLFVLSLLPPTALE